MWEVIKRAPQFIGSDSYVTVGTIGFNVDGGSQYAITAGQQESFPVTTVYPSVTAETYLPYNVGPCNAVAMDNIQDFEVYTHGNEDIQTNFDDAIEMDDTRDMYEEFIDNDGSEDNPEFLNELQVENNVDACPNLNPNPDWFTSNTWDNIHNPFLGNSVLKVQACFDDTSMTWLQPPKVHHRYCLRHVVRNVNTKMETFEVEELGSFRAPYGSRMDQNQDVGYVAKRGTIVEHVLLDMRSQQVVELHHSVISGVGLLHSTLHSSSSLIALDSSGSKATFRAPNIDPRLYADAEPTSPPPLSLRAMMETFMKTQAAHG
nr:hypothetical protein CFP56_26362 [Quercus suber]